MRGVSLIRSSLFLVRAVDAASNFTSPARITLISVIGVVGPVPLNLPCGSTRETQQVGSKSPRALVRVFVALPVIPRIQIGVGQHLG